MVLSDTFEEKFCYSDSNHDIFTFSGKSIALFSGKIKELLAKFYIQQVKGKFFWHLLLIMSAQPPICSHLNWACYWQVQQMNFYIDFGSWFTCKISLAASSEILNSVFMPMQTYQRAYYLKLTFSLASIGWLPSWTTCVARNFLLANGQLVYPVHSDFPS